MRWVLSGLKAVGWSVTFASVPSCSEAPTQIVVVVNPDAEIESRLTAVQVTMRRSGAAETVDAGYYPIPRNVLRTSERDGNLILRPRDPADSRPLVVTVVGELHDGTRVNYSVTTRFERGHTLYLDAPLVAACARVTNCPEGTTCREGTCVPVPEVQLVEVPPLRDASVRDVQGEFPEQDASMDTGVDASTDRGPNADGLDSPVDFMDTGTDAKSDALLDSANDARPEFDAPETSAGDVVSDSIAEAATADADVPSESDVVVDTVDIPVESADITDVLACSSGQSICGGVCTDLLTSTENCGMCGSACPLRAQSVASCLAGSCHFSCAVNYSDCDRNPDNGCETNASVDPLNCGACRAVCPSQPNASPTCMAGRCSFVCRTGFADCDGADSNGCEVSLETNSSHCGSCGTSCAPGLLCLSGTCSFSPPRQVAPLSSATVTSQSPMFRWTLPEGIDGARIQICRDRLCVVPELSADVLGRAFTSSMVLGRGVHFWRLFSRLGDVTARAMSPTWEFFVGPRSAPLNTSWGTTADFDADGYADLAVGAPNALDGTGAVYIYPGGASDVSASPSQTLSGRDGPAGKFGWSVESAGDVNGDGYADLIVGLCGAATGTLSPEKAYVYSGSTSGISVTPTTSLSSPGAAGDGFGCSVASAGDVNGDGYADVIVGAFWSNEAYVYLGGASGISSTPATTLARLITRGMGRFGAAVSSAGDVNGDGYADVVVGAYRGADDLGQAFVFRGSAAGLVPTPSIALTGPDGGFFGGSVTNIGDVNGDGYSDLAIGAGSVRPSGAVYVYHGGIAGITATPMIRLTGSDVETVLGNSVSSAGDINQDGYQDLVVGAHTYNSYTGRAFVFHGSSGGLRATPSSVMESPAGAGGYFGYDVAGAGDVNGDGFPDIIVGAYCALNTPGMGCAGTGEAFLYRGSASGANVLPTVSLTGPSGSSSWFGFSVANAFGVERVRTRRTFRVIRAPRETVVGYRAPAHPTFVGKVTVHGDVR